MPELQNTPELGQLFLTFDDLKKTLLDWSVREKFSFKVQKKDSSRGIYCCRVPDCPWRVRGNRTEDGDIKITVLVPEHNCIGLQMAEKRGAATRQDWIQDILPDYLVVTKETRPQEIIDCMRLRFGEEIDYQVALRAKKGLLSDGIHEHREAFAQIPAYIERLAIENPTAYTHFSVDQETRRFRRIFISPGQSRESFRSCRHFIAVDGTFLKSRFRQTLLLAVTIDANGHNLLLAWAIVESENNSSWEYFYLHLRNAIPEINTILTTIISDRDKGLLLADRVLPASVTRAYCCQHLKENFTTKFGRALEGLFWKTARANSLQCFELAMQEIREAKPTAETYLRDIDPQLWATAYFPGQRYGHDTSNIVESTNRTLKIDRELSTIHLLDSIWNRLMAERYKRAQIAIKDPGRFTKFCLKQLALDRAWARSNIVFPATPTTARIQQPNGHVYFVDLDTRTCTCKKYQENGIPCGHAIACILHFRDANRPLEHFLPAILSVDTWRATYDSEQNLKPVDISHLPLAPDVFPPFTVIPRGRPRKARLRPGEARQRAQVEERAGGIPDQPLRNYHCQTCGGTGHNSATCTTPHE